MTGGYIKEFYHEVYFGDDTAAAKQKAIDEGRSLWRVASTFFTHIEGSQILAPLEAFRTAETMKKYPEITGDEYFKNELAVYARE